MDELLTVRELAGYLKLNSATVMRKAGKGEIPAIKVGRQFRFNKGEIDKWLNQKSVSKAGSILVVDDEPLIGQYVKDLLGREGYQVEIAASGEAGIEFISTRSFDLIFLDLVLPGLSGPEVFKRVRSINKEVPIVFITGFPDSDLMKEALNQGPFTVIKKPLNSFEIYQTLNSFINSGVVKK